MEYSIFDKIRNSCEAVADNSRFVKINHDKIVNYAKNLPLDIAQNPVMDEVNHFVGEPADTAAFFFILDSINFGSGYFPYLKKYEGKTGYFTVAFLLAEFFRKNGRPTCDDLVGFTPELAAKIFRQDLENPEVMELMQMFSSALKELGEFVGTNFKSDFLFMLESCDGSAENLVETLAKMPMFGDHFLYHNKEVLFYKRAQIAVSDLEIAFKGEAPGKFNDIEKLTIFADNLVPHVLKLDGVLTFSEELENRIQKGELIDSGSDEEIEIRAVSLHAVELIKRELHQAGALISSQGLDYLLWNRGQEAFYRKMPRHCTKTFFY